MASRRCVSAAGRASPPFSSGHEPPGRSQREFRIPRGGAFRMTHKLLAPLRVIESSAFIAAPLAGLTLAQFGADVIRADLIGGGIDYGRLPRMPHPDGKGRSLYWAGLNKGKRSIAIDMRRPEGRELMRALVTAPGPEGGVLLTNIGTPWLAHGLLAQQRPDLISCTIQGNGDGSTAVDY